MSDHVQLLAANITCPEEDACGVVTSTTTTFITTLSATEHLGQLALSGNYLSLMADGADIVCYFHATGTGRTVSATSITKATRGWKLKDGIEVPVRLTRNAAGVLRTKIVHIATGAAKLRFRMSSSHSSEQIKR